MPLPRITDEALEALRQKYVGKLVQLLDGGSPAGSAGIVERIDRDSGYVYGGHPEGAVPRVFVRDRWGNLHDWYFNANGWTLEIYGG